MSEIKVKTGKDETALTVSVNYDIPTSVAGLVDKYGEEQVAALASRSITLAIQALVRQKVAGGAAVETLQATVDAWKPGVRGEVTKKSPVERAKAALAGVSKEELEALLAEYKSGKKGK